MAAATKGDVATASVKGSFVRLLPTGAPWAGAGERSVSERGGHLLNPMSVAAKSATSRPPSRRLQKKSAALAPIPIPIPAHKHQIGNIPF